MTVEEEVPVLYIVHVNKGRHIVPPEYRRHVKNRLSGKRVILWIEQDGLCHWCGILTRLPDDPGYYTSESDHAKLHKHAATLDHLYSRLHPLRKYRSTYVMACHSCNSERSKRECQGEFKSEHLRRSQENAGRKSKT